jgi:membrane-associated phospholipid phosphatase
MGARAGAVVSGAGLALLVPCAMVARDGRVGAAEESVFRALNELPDWLYRPLWIFQQFGNIVVAVAVVLVIAGVLRNRRLAIAAVAGAAAKLAFERVVKAVVERRRPGTSVGDIIARGEVSLDGLSFVSGHAVITTAFALAMTAALPRRWRLLPWVVVALNGVGRIYVGAHNPLDIAGGIGLGMVIGGGLYALVASGSEIEVEGHR